MASIGHVAVGLAAARLSGRDRAPRWRSMLVWSAIALLPDADVIGFTLGVDYADPWGHRGATHSIAASIVAGVVIGFAGRPFALPLWRTTLMAIAVLASHGILDTMTDGGLGCALLWPFDLTRYFAPWRPIPVAPIGLDFFSPHGAIVSLTELALFSPLLLLALRPSRRLSRTTAAGFLAAGLVSIWLAFSNDPARNAVVGFVVREDTVYATGFSERAFRRIRPGQSAQDVRRALGTPMGEAWYYPTAGGTPERAAESAAAAIRGCRAVRVEAGVVAAAAEPGACRDAGVAAGTSVADVRRALGAPTEFCWQYSWSPSDRRFRLRSVCFFDSVVEKVIREWR